MGPKEFPGQPEKNNKNIARIAEIDLLIGNKQFRVADYPILIEEKKKILVSLTETEIKELVDYTMAIIRNERTREETENAIRQTINDLKNNL